MSCYYSILNFELFVYESIAGISKMRGLVILLYLVHELIHRVVNRSHYISILHHTNLGLFNQRHANKSHYCSKYAFMKLILLIRGAVELDYLYTLLLQFRGLFYFFSTMIIAPDSNNRVGKCFVIYISSLY